MDWHQLSAASRRYGPSFFVFDEERFRQNYARLQAAFSRFYAPVKIGYSYKTNYTPYICKIVDELGGYAEIVSEMEYALTQKLDISPARVVFNGPYKCGQALAGVAKNGGVVNIDSDRDFDAIVRLARKHPELMIKAVVRCNFDIENGAISRFGIDVLGEHFPIVANTLHKIENIDFCGLHCHFPDRNLESYGTRVERILSLVEKYFPDKPPRLLNIGGGFLSGMPAELAKKMGIEHASFEAYGQIVGERLTRAFGVATDRPCLYLEPGTALVADTFEFYSQVVSTKNVRGRNVATLSGSIFDVSPTARSRHLPVEFIYKEGDRLPVERFDIVGYTCIEGDLLKESIACSVQAEDFVKFSNVGSYSVVMKPPFILPANPIVTKNGKNDPEDWKIIKHRETSDYVFQNFVL